MNICSTELHLQKYGYVKIGNYNVCVCMPSVLMRTYVRQKLKEREKESLCVIQYVRQEIKKLYIKENSDQRLPKQQHTFSEPE